MSLHSLGPLGWPLAEAANLYEATHTGTEGGYAKPDSDINERFANFVSRTAQFGENETFLRSIGQLLQAAGSVKDFGRIGEQEAASVLGSFIPQGALLSNIASATDPFARRPQTGDIGQALENRLPGLRSGIPLRLTPTGQPVANPQAGAGILLPRSSIAAPDPVVQALGAAGIGAPTVPKTVAINSRYSVDLTPAEQMRYQDLHGQALNDILISVVQDPEFKTLPLERQRQIIQRAMVRASDEARRGLLAEIPDADLTSRAALTSEKRLGALVTAGAP
jgi:hypothetical protein